MAYIYLFFFITSDGIYRNMIGCVSRGMLVVVAPFNRYILLYCFSYASEFTIFPYLYWFYG